VREEERVGRDRLARLAAVHLDAPLEGAPRAVQAVARGPRRVVDLLGVEVDHVGAGVRERPGDVAVEADHDAREPGDRHAVHVELAGHDEVRLVPDARQRELEVRVAGEERVAGGRAGRRHRPVVARQRRLVLGGEARGARREERARGRRGAGGERVGRAGRRQPERVDARRALPVGLDGLDDGLRHGKSAAAAASPTRAAAAARSTSGVR
jgi:hypothetical protein